MIDIKNLNFTINNNKILNNIDLRINDGEIIGIIGSAGSGKSTLLNIIAGKITGYNGTITIENKQGSSKPKISNKTFTLNRAIPLNSDDTLYNFLLLSRISYKKIFRSFSEFDKQVTEKYINYFELNEFIHAKIGSLSESILKKAILAHGFIREAYALLLDNPTNDLDIRSILSLKKTLSRYVVDGNKIIIICSHDINFISQIADRIIIMNKGSIAQMGNIEIINSVVIKKYFEVEIMLSKNIYNGKPEIHFFSDS